jgi:HEAT repeat protein
LTVAGKRKLGLLAALLAISMLSSGNAADDNIGLILEQLHSTSAVDRADAAEFLSYRKDPRIGPALTRSLNDQDRFVRWRAADAIGAQRYVPAVPVLTQLASSDPDATVRQKAQAALEAIKGTVEYKVYAVRSGSDVGERKSAASYLAFVADAPDIVPALIAALSDVDSGVRTAAAQSLATRKAREAAPALIDLFQSSRRNDPQTAVAAAMALGSIGDARAVDVLVSALRGDASVAGSAIVALGALKDPRAVSGLIELQKHDMELHSYEVATALKAIGQPGLDALVAALATSPPLPAEQRRAIALAIMYTEDPRIEDGTLRCLFDPDPAVRGRLATALGRMKSKAALAALQQLAKDADPQVSGAANGALRLIGKEGGP